MELRQDDGSVQLVKKAISVLSPDHPAQSYVRRARELQFSDAGLVDTFLHGRQRSYTIDQCVDLVAEAGLEFQGLLLKAPYYAHEIVTPSNSFYRAVNELPEHKLWSVMERVQSLNGCHFFIACRSDRPKESYVIDFSREDSLDCVPMFRMRCGLSGNEIFRPDWSLALNAAQLPFVQRIDGRCSIREIAESVAQSGQSRRGDVADVAKFARKLFQSLWRLDFLAMGLDAKSRS
jgi:hypothetical protein